MANNYTMFSEGIEDLTPEEKEWINNIPTREDFEDSSLYSDDDWDKGFIQALKDYGLDTNDVEDTIDDFPYFEHLIQENLWWLYAEESVYFEHVACLVQAFIKKFRPDYIFKITWCEYCDKPRIGEFGGGWVVVSKDEIIYGNAYKEVDEITEALKTGNFKC